MIFKILGTILIFVGVDRGREGSPLPALRTVRAVLPHTALQSVVSSLGSTCQHESFAHGEKPTFSEKGIWQQPMIFTSSARIGPLLMFAQNGPQATAYEAVQGTKRVMMGMLEVSKPAFDGRI
jgi:hypothetical protein